MRSPGTWDGRTDGSGTAHRRWHTAVGNPPAVADRRIGIVGFASDEGVRRNGGRPGAADGPTALRTALSDLALHDDLDVHDSGDVVVDGPALEAGQDHLGDQVAALLLDRRLPLVFGGGHETAYGTYRGLRRSGVLRDRRLGIVNLDAHFDMRTSERATSGTPFLQIAEDQAADGRDFRYTVLGLSRTSNTAAVFATARQWGVEHRYDEDCQDPGDPDLSADLGRFVDEVDVVYLSVDLDVLPAATAPGVSAPAALGVPLAVVLAVCRAVGGSGKLAAADITELNPSFDIDRRTARAAARIAHTIATADTAPDLP